MIVWKGLRAFSKLVPQAETLGPLKRIKAKLGRKVIYRLLTAASITGFLVAYNLLSTTRKPTATLDKAHTYLQPSEVLELGISPDFHTSYLVGVVKVGSLKLERGTLKHSFVLTDFIHEVTVTYSGNVPVTLREAETARVQGEFVDPYSPKEFVATRVEAAHDAEQTKVSYKPRSRDIDTSSRALPSSPTP
jgi:cytochrome c-type biogenesis protein CcmE